MEKLMEYAKNYSPNSEYEYIEEENVVIITSDNGKWVFEAGYYTDGSIYCHCLHEPMD